MADALAKKGRKAGHMERWVDMAAIVTVIAPVAFLSWSILVGR